MIHVHTMRNGIAIGEFRGFTTRKEAEEFINSMRNARDNDPSWQLFKKGNYDWNILLFIEDPSTLEFIETRIVY